MLRLLELLTLGIIEFCVVRQGEVKIVERRGEFVRVAGPGVQLLLALWGYGDTIGRFTLSKVVHTDRGPVLVPEQDVQSISTEMQVDDYPKESCNTRDNATVFIDAVVYYKVVEPDKAVYQVEDYVAALQRVVQSALRSECGKYELDELLNRRDEITAALRATLDHDTDPWGIRVHLVELKDIDLADVG